MVRDLNNIPREAELLRTALVAAHVDIELINMKDFPLGQKQTSRHLQPMSALPPKADIGTQSRNVRFVPKADSCAAAISSFTPRLAQRPAVWTRILYLVRTRLSALSHANSPG